MTNLLKYVPRYAPIYAHTTRAHTSLHTSNAVAYHTYTFWSSPMLHGHCRSPYIDLKRRITIWHLRSMRQVPLHCLRNTGEDQYPLSTHTPPPLIKSVCYKLDWKTKGMKNKRHENKKQKKKKKKMTVLTRHAKSLLAWCNTTYTWYMSFQQNRPPIWTGGRNNFLSSFSIRKSDSAEQ